MVLEAAMDERTRRTERRRLVTAFQRQKSLKAWRRYTQARRGAAARRGHFAASIASSSRVAATPSSSGDAAVASGVADAASRRASAAAIRRAVAALAYLPDEDTPPVATNAWWAQPLWGGSTGEAVCRESSEEVVPHSVDKVMPDFTEEVLPVSSQEFVLDSSQEFVLDSSQEVVSDSKVKIVLQSLDKYQSSVSEHVLAMHEAISFHHVGQSWQQIQVFLSNSSVAKLDKASPDSLNG